MKKIIYISLFGTILFLVSCMTTEKKSTVSENQLEQTLMLTQQIFQHYTTYLTSKDTNEINTSAKLLLETLNDLSKINYDTNNPLQLQCHYEFDSASVALGGVYLGSQKLGIAWNVQIDSFLNVTNSRLKIINYEELMKNSNR
ncbi:hypothetical protein ACUNWD_08840 [Sunxiuqinia sp. A32]|uniref:hypothetical protein n=1 Tax=Sunxiuqinia sp. A32 TaxID=3461496 RepID=UPI004045B1D3